MDAVMVEEFGRLYTSGLKPKKIMESLGIDYATYRKLFKEWKKRKKERKEEREEEQTAEEENTEEKHEEDPEEHQEEEPEEPEFQENEENQEDQEEEESDNESYEEECNREYESEKESENQSTNKINYNEIVNNELRDFFEGVGELEVNEGNSDEENEEDTEDEDVEEIIGDAKETILFFICMWLFLLSLKFPGDFMEKLDFINEFIERRERQIRRMVEKIDRVLRNYAKLYNMLVKVQDWTFLMDIVILTLTFKSEMSKKFILENEEHEVEPSKKTSNKKKRDELMEEKSDLDIIKDSKIIALIGGAEYVSNSA